MNQPHNPAPQPPALPDWRPNTWILAGASLLVTISYNAAFPFFPLMLRQLGAPPPLESWVGGAVGLFFTLSFLLTPVWGLLGDHYGNKTMVLRASLGMGALFALLPWMPGLFSFLILFVLVGATNGFVAGALTLTAANTPAPYLGRALALVQTGSLAGNSLGPLVGAWAAHWLGEARQLFWISASFALSAGLLVAFKVREAPPISQTLRLNPLAGLGRLLAQPLLRRVYGLNFLLGMVFFGSNAVVSVAMVKMYRPGPDSWGLELESWVGLGAMGVSISSALAVLAWGRALDRWSPGRVVAPALGLSALAMAATALAGGPPGLALGRVAFGLAAAGLGPALMALLRQLAPPGQHARATSIGVALSMLGMGAGPFLAGLMGPLWGLPSYWWALALLLALGALLWQNGWRRLNAAGGGP